MKFEFYDRLLRSQEFTDWQKNNPQYYLTHFYCQINSSFQLISPWEVGFYHPKKNRIITFVISDSIEARAEEEPLKEKSTIKRLNPAKIKINYPEAFQSFQTAKQKNYPRESLLNGLLILQHLQDKIVWNLSFATRSLQILNLKLDASTQQVISHQLINFIEQKAG